MNAAICKQVGQVSRDMASREALERMRRVPVDGGGCWLPSHRISGDVMFSEESEILLQQGNLDATSSARDLHLAIQVVRAIEGGSKQAALAALEQLADSSTLLPRSWLQTLAKALRDGNWDLLSEPFARHELVGDGGYFLIVAPYAVVREAQRESRLTAVLGKVRPHRSPSVELLDEVCRTRVVPLRQPIPVILPFECLAACGSVGGESGEAFVVSNNWGFSDSALGPSLNDMSEQARRFDASGRACMLRIWDADSAAFLLEALDGEQCRFDNWNLEYQFHEVGHAAGLGFHKKLAEGLFPTYWYGAVEEWRADGVGLEVAVHSLDVSSAAKVAKVNMCVRLALDAHRGGGPNRDVDVCAAMLALDRLLESGLVTIKNKQMALSNLDDNSLLQVFELHRREAVRLTREEQSLDYTTGVYRLYGSIKLNPIAEKMFQSFVLEPCSDLYTELR